MLAMQFDQLDTIRVQCVGVLTIPQSGNGGGFDPGIVGNFLHRKTGLAEFF